MGDLLAQVGLGDLLHLSENHGGDLLRGELLVLAINLHLNNRLAILAGNLEGEVLEISLDIAVLELATNESPVEKWLAIKCEFLRSYE